MKKVISVVVVAIVIAIIAYFAFPFVNSTISKTVDLEVAKAVDRENENLPREIEQGVVLERIINSPKEKKLTFRYKVKRNLPESRFDEVKRQTNQRILDDKNLVRALNNGIQVVHQFSDNSRRIVLEFETTQ